MNGGEVSLRPVAKQENETYDDRKPVHFLQLLALLQMYELFHILVHRHPNRLLHANRLLPPSPTRVRIRIRILVRRIRDRVRLLAPRTQRHILSAPIPALAPAPSPPLRLRLGLRQNLAHALHGHHHVPVQRKLLVPLRDARRGLREPPPEREPPHGAERAVAPRRARVRHLVPHAQHGEGREAEQLREEHVERVEEHGVEDARAERACEIV